MSPLAQKVAELVDEALLSTDGSVMFRGDVDGKTWKIAVTYDADRERMTITVKRREATQ